MLNINTTPDPRPTKIHVVKSWPKLFGEILAGTRKHDLRLNDRDYQVRDTLWLHEYDPDRQAYTGRDLKVVISAMTSGAEGLSPDYVVLSIEKDRSAYSVPGYLLPIGGGQLHRGPDDLVAIN